MHTGAGDSTSLQCQETPWEREAQQHQPLPPNPITSTHPSNPANSCPAVEKELYMDIALHPSARGTGKRMNSESMGPARDPWGTPRSQEECTGVCSDPQVLAGTEQLSQHHSAPKAPASHSSENEKICGCFQKRLWNTLCTDCVYTVLGAPVEQR